MTSPRIDFQSPEDAPEQVRQIYQAVKGNFGQVLNIVKVLGQSPPSLKGVMELLGASQQFELEPRYAELAYLKTSQVNECHY